NREEAEERDRALHRSRSDARSEPLPFRLTKETAHPLLHFASPKIRVRRARSTPYGGARTELRERKQREGGRGEAKKKETKERGGRPALTEEKHAAGHPNGKLGFSPRVLRERVLR
ncbi:unnamed protein product, partial [Brassica rapa subsp. narinosa]